ncbi:hypothetical protein J5N97_025637 [Dioscorea zingiberensis]|uniref:Cytochrome P450 n=1 Tax=Dioscorea zingiberensis TaxID=325984 RepID=A0A9D5C179_9LILI|nr:hypothetical protein J5N97_025637 [Dioscorea zingiberensis]
MVMRRSSSDLKFLSEMEKSLLSLFMTCMALFIILLTLSRRLKLKKRKISAGGVRPAQLPRGSLGWPFIGETLEFISCAYSPRPESFMDKRRLLYGKVFKSHIFGSPTIVSTDAEVSRVVLQSDAKAFVPSYPKSLTELMGKSSILLINGGLHRRVHGLIGAFFKSPLLKSQITTDMHKYVKDLMSGWQDNQLIFIQDETKHIVFHILVRVLIGLEPGEEMQFLKHNFQEFIAGLMSLPVKLPGSRLYKSLQAKKKMVMLVEKIIKEKRKNMNNSSDDDQKAPRDVIDVLLNDNSLKDDLISDNMIDLMIPGEDSVPILVTLAIKYLSDCPLALHQLENENIQLKEKKSKQGESSTLNWTDYLSLHCYQDDMEIKGHFIPKGWCVFTYFRSVHLDETLYEDPHQFNPWRWKDKDMNSCGFTAFGGGQRLCPGLDLARLEASIFLHHLVTNFTWVAEEDQVVNFPTVRMKRRMPIRVKRKVAT